MLSLWGFMGMFSCWLFYAQLLGMLATLFPINCCWYFLSLPCQRRGGLQHLFRAVACENIEAGPRKTPAQKGETLMFASYFQAALAKSQFFSFTSKGF